MDNLLWRMAAVAALVIGVLVADLQSGLSQLDARRAWEGCRTMFGNENEMCKKLLIQYKAARIEHPAFVFRPKDDATP
ncbi:MAG: hypothetical protein ACLPX9_14430 [Rhodomicrobium sp.]